jgi:hypothetical protein
VCGPQSFARVESRLFLGRERKYASPDSFFHIFVRIWAAQPTDCIMFYDERRLSSRRSSVALASAVNLDVV